MKWIAKRILLNSHPSMDATLTHFIVPVVERFKKMGITEWYCSRKTEDDGSLPSVRIYIRVEEEDETHVLNELNNFLKERGVGAGWTGSYMESDPDLPDPEKFDLKRIQQGCEIALKLMNKYPDPDRHTNSKFVENLKVEVTQFLVSMHPNYDLGAIHFIANNLGLKDEFVISLVSTSRL